MAEELGKRKGRQIREPNEELLVAMESRDSLQSYSKELFDQDSWEKKAKHQWQP